jgi:hypothetical protein
MPATIIILSLLLQIIGYRTLFYALASDSIIININLYAIAYHNSHAVVQYAFGSQSTDSNYFE